MASVSENTEWLRECASNLDELADLLNRMEADLEEGERIDDMVDLALLPVFGGDAPDERSKGIYSWDATRYLIRAEGDEAYCWMLVDR